jgi:hypothetical protein
MQIGFRRLLPVLFTVMHVTVLFYAAQWQHQSSAFGTSREMYHPAAFQEDGPKWEPIEPKPLTPAWKIALLLNLPSLLLAIPVAAAVFRDTDAGILYAALPFVPLVWYGIGRWIDATLGWLTPRRHVPRSLSGPLAVIFTALLVLSALTVTPVNHHRRPDTYWAGAALIMWSGLPLAMSLSSFYLRPSRLALSTHHSPQ